MSGDQQAPSSFGDPNAQPPTPKQTPTSAVFPSPIFETPKQRQGQFPDTGNWTPRFAEEYSVFNTTPGNLSGSSGIFADFSSLTQQFHPTAAAHKRQLSAEGIAAEIASHATHFSPDSNLPPVDPSRTLQSSPRSTNANPDTYSEEEDNHQASLEATPGSRSTKKAKKGKGVDRAPQGQIATPPPSSHKGGRKLAPKLTTDAMQNDQGYGQPDFVTGTPQQPGMAGFSATDMFGYPMSAPAAAGANFWDPSADMGAMDLDFSAFGHNIFQTPTQTPVLGHRPMNSFDATQMFQEPSMPEESQPSHQQVPQIQQPKQSKKERPLAPKTSLPQVGTTTAATTSMTSNTYPAPSEDPFGIVSPGSGVNPGLLFSRPQSSSMDNSFPVSQPDPMTQFSLDSVAQALSKPPARGDIRRSNSTRELAPSKLPDRAMASSPIKSNGRPGLQRSFSENRGRRNAARNSLPTLAPAIRPNTTIPSGPVSGPSRPPSSRSSGRTSPLKNHNRLSSLTSIPEAVPPRTRTSVKFTIDSTGRARAETTVIVEDPNIVPVAQGRPPLGLRQRERSFESEDDGSSTDDEPIIIPSRNTSFALPDPQKPTGSFFHASQRSISERSNSSFATLTGEVGNDVESEAETVMNESRGGRGGGGGDATSELRKLVESRQKRNPQLPGSAQRSQRFFSGGFAGHPGNTASPASFTDASLLTPSTHAGGMAIRCVCHRNENDPDVGLFMVQCESCEMYLHGKCINIPSKRMMPSVYICTFCINTPNMRGGRMRDRGAPGAVGTSPLAHKSFKSFR